MNRIQREGSRELLQIHYLSVNLLLPSINPRLTEAAGADQTTEGLFRNVRLPRIQGAVHTGGDRDDQCRGRQHPRRGQRRQAVRRSGATGRSSLRGAPSVPLDNADRRPHLRCDRRPAWARVLLDRRRWEPVRWRHSLALRQHWRRPRVRLRPDQGGVVPRPGRQGHRLSQGDTGVSPDRLTPAPRAPPPPEACTERCWRKDDVEGGAEGGRRSRRLRRHPVRGREAGSFRTSPWSRSRATWCSSTTGSGTRHSAARSGAGCSR